MHWWLVRMLHHGQENIIHLDSDFPSCSHTDIQTPCIDNDSIMLEHLSTAAKMHVLLVNKLFYRSLKNMSFRNLMPFKTGTAWQPIMLISFLINICTNLKSSICTIFDFDISIILVVVALSLLVLVTSVLSKVAMFVIRTKLFVDCKQISASTKTIFKNLNWNK